MMQAFYHGSLLTHPIRSVGKTRIAVAKNERHTVGLDDSQKQEIRNARRRHVSLATIHGELISCYKKSAGVVLPYLRIKDVVVWLNACIDIITIIIPVGCG